MGFFKGFCEEIYNVSPRIVECGKKTKITVSPASKKFCFDHASYDISFFPFEISKPDASAKKSVNVVPKNGKLEFEYTFSGEQEWVILVNSEGESGDAMRFHIYSLDTDLYERFPFMGELHSHSCCSDGAEDPAVVAANHRKEGLDFISLTDHHRQYPSAEMIKAFENIAMDFKMYFGEEIHICPEIDMHIIGFGNREGVTNYFEKNKETALKEIAEISEKLDVPDDISPYECAFRCWVSQKIHEFGGISIIAHPFWFTRDNYNMNPSVVKWLMKNGKFDAMEIVSGQGVEENNLQTAFYYEMRSEGIKVPAVGTSDCHKTTKPISLFGFGKTVVFAKENSFEEICDGIKNLYSVALDCAPSNAIRIHGTYRMVKYTQFLLKYYFPKHNSLCVEEGIQMENFYFDGNKASLENLKGRTTEFMKEFMGKI